MPSTIGLMSDDKTSGLGRAGRWLRLHLLRSVRENASPGRTSLGLALGVFIGIFPSFLIGTPLAFYVAGKLGLNRAAAVAGTIVSMNPITAPFVYSFSTWLGFRILDREVVEMQALDSLWAYLAYVKQYAAPFFLGNTVVAAVIAAILGGAMFTWTRRGGSVRSIIRKPKTYDAARPSEPVDVQSAP